MSVCDMTHSSTHLRVGTDRFSLARVLAVDTSCLPGHQPSDPDVTQMPRASVDLRNSGGFDCSDEKCDQCAKRGATNVINYKTEDFAEVVNSRTKVCCPT